MLICWLISLLTLQNYKPHTLNAKECDITVKIRDKIRVFMIKSLYL